jgi:hypothetical protein
VVRSGQGDYGKLDERLGERLFERLVERFGKR